MIDRIKAIIEREVTRLDELSTTKGLGLDEIRALELLGKVQRSFEKTPTDPSEPPTESSQPSTAELLEGLADDK